MKLKTDNRILLIDDKVGNRVPFRMEKIQNAILKAGRKVGGFQADVHDGINAWLFLGKSDEDIAEFLTHDVMGRLNANPQYLTPNTPAPLDEIHRMVIVTLRFWGLRGVADEYQFYSSGRLWVRRGAMRESDFSQVPYPEQLVEEAAAWNRRMRTDTVAGINEWVATGKLPELIGASIDEYGRQLHDAADKFLARKGIRIFMVTGPSSSGKTTTTHKITQLIQERTGQKFAVFSADNYFYSVDQHPTDQSGDRDYERARAYEIPLMRNHIYDLLEGKVVDTPIFDFKSGRRSGTEPLQLTSDQVLIIDCLHGLFPYITAGIPDEKKFKVFLFNANRVLEDDGSSGRAIPFTLVNMFRRMLRDTKHRNKDIRSILGHWHYVRDGELTDMLPFLRTANAFVNGGLAFDLPILQHYLAGQFPRADQLPEGMSLDACLRCAEGNRVLDSITPLTSDPESLIPGDCHVREFIGGLMLAIPHQT
ncbi:MAG: hypothetical protein HYY25_09395 [Candidatus Wallbacteria bacterium]|nr:hypothetical protein [Candidatus Wallbacteria bacterium]